MKLSDNRGFSTAEMIGGLLMFSAATSCMLYVGKSMRSHQQAAFSSSVQNAYATFESQMTLQGINPSLAGNPLQGVINQAGTAGTVVSLGQNTAAQIVRAKVAAFELGSVTLPSGAQRSLAGSAYVDAVNYNPPSSGAEGTRGAGIGFSIAILGPAVQTNAIPLAPPTFIIQGDLSSATFPITANVCALPSSNPPGTVYRYTTDGTTPTSSSLVWDNTPGWTQSDFPSEVTIVAFNTDSQYAPSQPVTATYSMELAITYSRADGRTSNLYGFTLSDLSDPSATGIVLTSNDPSIPILYTLDGSNPLTSSTVSQYDGPFVPSEASFSSAVTLTVASVSTSPQIASSAVTPYTLTSISVPLQPPSFLTSNAAPLSPGTDVQISVSGSNASPRTEVNNGVPGTNSSQATSFPLN